MRFRPAVRYGLPVLLLAAGALAWTLASRPESRPAAGSNAPAPDSRHQSIACLGRILPEDGLFRLSARSLSGQPAIVARLFVADGEAIRRGQVLAVLDSQDQLEAAWQAAEARAGVAVNRLAQVKAGAKPGDLQAQRAEIARLGVELVNAEREYRRYQDLHKEQVVSEAELDDRRMRAQSSAELLTQAKERLNSLAEVRAVDVAHAEADVQAAVKAAAQARAELEQAQIRSPIDGRVIAIHTWPGEEVQSDGIMEVGKTDRMYVIAEVDERDLPHLKVGQRATVTGSALSQKLHGVVEYISLAVMRNEQTDLDPIAPSDTRVVETKIRLDDAAKAARLINAQVTVLIAR
jgi:HlyD family secretion protein